MSGEELLEEAKKTLDNLLVDDTIYTVLYVEYDYRAEVKFLITGNKSHFDQILRNEQESIRLTILRDTLLPKLMSGELKINATEVL
jgi:hypothetical protein